MDPGDVLHEQAFDALLLWRLDGGVWLAYEGNHTVRGVLNRTTSMRNQCVPQ